MFFKLKKNFTLKRMIYFCFFIFIGILVIQKLILLGGYAKEYFPQQIVVHRQYKKNEKNPHLAYMYLNILYNFYTQPEKQDTIFIINLLKKHLSHNPNDVYNSKYLTMIGDIYLSLDSPYQALYYYKDSITPSNHNTFPIINFHKAQTLSMLEYNIYTKIKYNKILLSKYNNTIERIPLLYTQGQLYDTLGLWDEAYNMYKSILLKHQTISYDKYKDLSDTVFFRNKRKFSKKSYRTWDSVADARQALLHVLSTRNRRALNAMKAPGFFTAQWQEDRTNSNAQVEFFDVISVLNKSNFSVDTTLQTYGDGKEVLWTTYGWERVGTWHMVFRQIQSPDTIALNGRWEWIGIYFGIGNKLYVYNE